MPEFSIILPMYNEEACAAQVLAEMSRTLGAAGLDYEIITVDNGSRDRTGEIIDDFARDRDPRVRKAVVEVNQGMGHGILVGLAAARGAPLGWTYGDGQVPAEYIPRILAAMRERHADVGKMVRTSREDGPYRWLISRVYNLLFRLMFHTRARDINGAPKLFTRAVYERIALTSKDWFIDAEFMVRAARAKLSVAEVEGRFEQRRGGRSHVRFGAILEFLRNMLRLWRAGDR